MTYAKVSLQQRLEAMVEELVDDSGALVSFRNDYSGRGMMGKSCVALVGKSDDCLEVVRDIINNMHDEAFEHARDSESAEELGLASHLNIEACNAVEGLLKFKTDSMGFDIVMYWPALEPIDYSTAVGFDAAEELSLHEGFEPPQ